MYTHARTHAHTHTCMYTYTYIVSTRVSTGVSTSGLLCVTPDPFITSGHNMLTHLQQIP